MNNPLAVVSLLCLTATAAQPMTVSRIDRHVTRTITVLMQRLAESRIPSEPRSALNERLLAVQAESSAAAQAGQPPAGEDAEQLSARLGKSLDAIAGAIDSAATRAERLVTASSPGLKTAARP